MSADVTIEFWTPSRDAWEQCLELSRWAVRAEVAIWMSSAELRPTDEGNLFPADAFAIHGGGPHGEREVAQLLRRLVCECWLTVTARRLSIAYVSDVVSLVQDSDAAHPGSLSLVSVTRSADWKLADPERYDVQLFGRIEDALDSPHRRLATWLGAPVRSSDIEGLPRKPWIRPRRGR